MGSKRPPRRPLADRREYYLQVFGISFAVMLLLMAPVMLFTGGYFIYYGDFNSQQLPFYQLAHAAVTSGDLGWNWRTDLGVNFIGSYSFYLLGSPFFWLTTLFPNSWVLYLMPWLLALKHAFAALTAYAWMRRFVRSRNAALIGGLLYAFSGFQMYNVFFNHFQDVTAFFPLLLIAMEQRVNEDRRGVFAVTVAFMAILNYYFFTGEAVFAILYFICRCPAKDFHADLRKFFSIALEAVLGVLMACFMLLPSALAIIDNYRVKKYLWGMDMVAYSDRTRLWRIIQSFFMLPDVPARPNLFQSDYGKWASIGGYLPLFSMAGVLSFMSQKKNHWATRITAVCIVCAMVPVLNSMFYMFNSSYYARWYFMPILIMAYMTAQALDDPAIHWKRGIITCAIMLGGFGVISLLPTKDQDGKVHFLEFAKYGWYFWITLAICAAMLIAAAMLVRSRRSGRKFYPTAVGATVLGCLATGFAMIYFGIGLGANPTAYVNAAIEGGGKITLEDEPGQFYRVDISEDYDNYPMFWGYSNMRCFHSIVPTSIMDFYDAMGITRDVASRPDTKNYGLRELFSVKYYFDRAKSEDAATYSYTLPDMPSFSYLKKENGFYIYENKAYIPMGLAYDQYISREELEKSSSTAREKIMVKALALNAEQIAKYEGLLSPLPQTEKYNIADADFAACCETRAAQTCSLFEPASDGFYAEISLEQPNMVFFSVPYEHGWSAEVNGRPVDVERVNYGFMAVPCEAGENKIQFRYETPGLRAGAVASVCGLAGLLIYLLWMAILSHGKTPDHPRRKHSYDYSSIEQMFEHDLYMRYAASRHTAKANRARPRRAAHAAPTTPTPTEASHEHEEPES